MANIRLRQLKETELETLHDLWTVSSLPFRARGRDSLPNLRKQRKADPELFIGAFDGKKMLGAVIASDDGRKAWINRLAVAPNVRGKGLGSALIKKSEKILRSRGRRIFCVHIEEDNPESEALFRKSGYQKETRIFYYTKRDRKDY